MTANLAAPGFGSITGGRVAGYFQAALTVAGMVLTLGAGMEFLLWYMTNRARLGGPDVDPLATMEAIWVHVRWAFFGMGLFAASWLWALGTGLSLLAEAKRNEAAARTAQTDTPPGLEDGSSGGRNA